MGASRGPAGTGYSGVLQTATPVAKQVHSQLEASREIAADLKRQADLMKKLELFLKGFKRTLHGAWVVGATAMFGRVVLGSCCKLLSAMN